MSTAEPGAVLRLRADGESYRTVDDAAVASWSEKRFSEVFTPRGNIAK